MPPIVSVVGKAKVGKTQVLEVLVRKLKEKGYRVAVIKHTGEDFELDIKGKDSWRLTEAGSDAVILSSSHKVALMQTVVKESSLAELARLVGGDYDIVFTEGFKKANAPKIEVHARGVVESQIVSPPEDLIALVTEQKIDLAVPQFSWDDLDSLAQMVEKLFLVERQKEEVALFVNQAPVPLNLFMQGFLARILEVVVSTLKGAGPVSTLDMWLRKRS